MSWKIISKEWNENNVRLYGAVNCISEKGQDKIIEHADNHLALQSSLFLNEEDNILEKDATMFPWKFKKFAVELFGPLANYWEGGNCGEWYLRHIKPRIHDVHTKNWNTNVYINLLNVISMGLINLLGKTIVLK